MESRKVIVVNSETQKTTTIMSNAETLGELKMDLMRQGMRFSDNDEFHEGASHTILKEDSAQLPRDINYKGQVTNDLVFMVTQSGSKIKNGSERSDLYNKIKGLDIANLFVERYGKNYTQCKTEILKQVVDEIETSRHQAVTTTVTLKDILAAIDDVRDMLAIYLEDYQVEDSPVKTSGYTDSDIHEMFQDILG